VIASVTGSITSAIGDWGLYAVFLLMALDAVFPAASELVMLYAGALASGAIAGQSVTLFGDTISSGFWAYVAMALAGTLGYLVGAIAGWAIGLYGGRPLLERHGRWFHLGPERMARAERWFERWGDAAVFLGRITPIVRSFCSIPAGVFRMPLGRYSLLTLAGSAIWCFALAGIGYAIGSSWHGFHDSFRYVDYAVLALVLLAGIYLIARWYSSRLTRRVDDPAD
jgi:membrane protein DedA with SNARE-associated domain